MDYMEGSQTSTTMSKFRILSNLNNDISRKWIWWELSKCPNGKDAVLFYRSKFNKIEMLNISFDFTTHSAIGNCCCSSSNLNAHKILPRRPLTQSPNICCHVKTAKFGWNTLYCMYNNKQYYVWYQRDKRALNVTSVSY